MKIFGISVNDHFVSLDLIDFDTTDEYDCGYYFKVNAKVNCNGFTAETSEFFMNNRALQNLAVDLKKIYDNRIKEVLFRSESHEFNIKFFVDNKENIFIEVFYQHLHEGDQFKTTLKIDFPTLEPIIQNLKDFSLSFPFEE